jgi:orotate phosphoribosyltransferase
VPITPEETLAFFEQTGAYLRGHFRLTSGLHSPEYLQCALVLQHPAIAERLGAELAAKLGEIAAPDTPDLVVAPAMGGLIIGHEVARAFGVPFVFTERDATTRQMQLRRGFTLPQGAKAVVVEDVITTGGSTREVVEILASQGVKVLAAGSIMDRSGGAADVGVPRAALATLSVQTFTEEACPLCAQGTPVVKPGSRPVG